MKKVLKTRGVCFFRKIAFFGKYFVLEGKNILKKWNVMKNRHEDVIFWEKMVGFSRTKSDPKRIGGFVEFLGEPES